MHAKIALYLSCSDCNRKDAKVELIGMSAAAGLLLIVYGAVTAYLVRGQLVHPVILTPFAAFITTVLAIFLVLVGLAHFRAPHKAFLTSIILLVYLHVQMYFNALFYFARPLWPQQISLLAISALILMLSYLGYSRRLHAVT